MSEARIKPNTPQGKLSPLRPIVAYFLLSLLMTWPTVLHLTGGIPGDGFDGWQNYWNMWWVKTALLTLGTSPYFTDLLYPPTGTSLLFHTLNIFNSFWTLPLQLNFGLAIAYNSVVLVSFTLAGYGGYLLSLHTLTRLNLRPRHGLRLAAFVGGVVFTMSPFHLAHLLGHMQVFSIIWPPFYVLWLLRTLENSSSVPFLHSRAKSEIRNIGLSCLFLILAALVDWYHALYLLIFTGLALLWALNAERLAFAGRIKRFSLRPLWLTLAIGLGFAVILSPLLLPMMQAARTTPSLDTGLEQSVTLSADLLAFGLPSEMHPLWGEWAKTIANHFTGTTSERLIFAGFVPLILGLFALIRCRREPPVKFWAFITAVYFILALGPYLHINGQVVTIGGWPVPLPYLLLYYLVPFIRLTRSLSRYDLMVMLGLGVLVAIALVRLTSMEKPATKIPSLQTTDHKLPTGLYLLVTALICFEFVAIPYPISLIDTPQFYYNLATDPADFTIAELPMNWDRPTPMLYQTIHGKRLLTAYTSRDNPLELARRMPVFQHWRNLGPDIIDLPLAEIAPTIFYDFNLRYIVLDYWQMPPGPEREATERWVAAALPGAAPIYADGRLKVYQSPPKTKTQPYLSLGDGWGNRQSPADGSSGRAITGEHPAELFLHHPQNQAISLELTATAPVTNTLILDEIKESPGQLPAENLVAQIQIGPTPSLQTVSLPLSAGDLLKLRLKMAIPTGEITVSRVSLQINEQKFLNP